MLDRVRCAFARAVPRSIKSAGLAAGSLLLLALPQTPAQAASAGLKPSQAPFVTVGQHYFGNATHAVNSWKGAVDLWRLPPLLISDTVSIAWNGADHYKPGLCLAQDIDDYSWDNNICNASADYQVSKRKHPYGNPSQKSYVGCLSRVLV